MPIDTNALRARLDDFRARKEAIDEAVLAGPDGVDAAVALLDDRKEAVRWSASRMLTEAGDMRAVGPLLDLMERDTSRTDAANALRAITGANLGDDPAAWREWAEANTEVKAKSERAEMSDEDLVAAATRDLDADVATRKGRYVVTVRLPEGRHQSVYIVFGSKDTEGQPIVWLYTPCCDASPDKYEWALMQNLRMPHGAIGLATIEGKKSFVMSNTHLRATVDPEDIAKSLLVLAGKGDEVEKLLSGQDNR